jgi:hypothetical protein
MAVGLGLLKLQVGSKPQCARMQLPVASAHAHIFALHCQLAVTPAQNNPRPSLASKLPSLFTSVC